ncbi:hypothetical protein CPB85DRAFT_1325257 [Mucidula mucida]|nr:hypothetical protein CPB85DRAFT_1325257 [Mucidula mucida]
MDTHDDVKTATPHAQLRYSFFSLLWASLKLAFYTLITTEREHEAFHKVRLFRFGIPFVMKKTLRTESTEADALRFLNKARPNLPIPRLLDSFVVRDATYTVMTKLPGETLLEQPLPATQLPLWEIRQPACFEGRVMCSASGHGLPNPMTLHSNLAATFPSTLHCYALMTFKSFDQFLADTDPVVLERLAGDPVTWVHTDLRLQNILVKDGHLRSGWLPRHWQLHMFRNAYMHGVTFDWWAFWKERKIDAKVEAVYDISLG